MRITLFSLLTALAAVQAAPARAEFIISSAIVEFTADGPRQQDIELISRSKDNDYVVSEVSEIVKPGLAGEERRPVEDPASAGLLVTPDKTILAGGGRKLLRFVLLQEPGEQERIYRVAVKPVIRGVENQAKVGLKVLIGYEVLVIVRPAAMAPAYTAHRQGKTFTVANTGNTDILFQHGQQCAQAGSCKLTPIIRVYAGGSDHFALPQDLPVTFSVWDGRETVSKVFE
jgi:P pilus assembly chaperone PapD